MTHVHWPGTCLLLALGHGASFLQRMWGIEPRAAGSERQAALGPTNGLIRDPLKADPTATCWVSCGLQSLRAGAASSRATWWRKDATARHAGDTPTPGRLSGARLEAREQCGCHVREEAGWG